MGNVILHSDTQVHFLQAKENSAADRSWMFADFQEHARMHIKQIVIVIFFPMTLSGSSQYV